MVIAEQVNVINTCLTIPSKKQSAKRATHQSQLMFCTLSCGCKHWDRAEKIHFIFYIKQPGKGQGGGG